MLGHVNPALATAYASEENRLQGFENPHQIDCMLGLGGGDMLGTSARVAELISIANCYTRLPAGQALLCLTPQGAYIISV